MICVPSNPFNSTEIRAIFTFEADKQSTSSRPVMDPPATNSVESRDSASLSLLHFPVVVGRGFQSMLVVFVVGALVVFIVLSVVLSVVVCWMDGA